MNLTGSWARRLGSVDRTWRYHPFAGLTRVSGDEVEVAVVVQHRESCPLRNRRDDEIRHFMGGRVAIGRVVGRIATCAARS